MKQQHWLRRLTALLAAACLILGCCTLAISCLVQCSVKDRIITRQEAAGLQADCILVLGAAIWADNTPCPMLQDRLDEAIALYRSGLSAPLLMSGGTSGSDYDEPGVMADYALSHEIPSDDILLDRLGDNTYQSILRARTEFGADTIVIVTQKYHLYRALYIARQLGMNAYGVASDPRSYTGQCFREAREILARCKDFFNCILNS